MAEGITQTCRDASLLNNHLEPALFSVDPVNGAITLMSLEYSLGQAMVESYFILWRLTHNEKYRRWGWDVVIGLESSLRQEDSGYSSVHDWNPTYFLSATLKVTHS